MLTFSLKKEWYEKIRSGEKTVEYREVKSYWTARIKKELEIQAAFVEDFEEAQRFEKTGFIECPMITCVLRLGYTKRQMTADITKIEVVDGKDTDLHVDKPVYAIHLANVREEE